jgi:hypothetical protein
VLFEMLFGSHDESARCGLFVYLHVTVVNPGAKRGAPTRWLLPYSAVCGKIASDA